MEENVVIYLFLSACSRFKSVLQLFCKPERYLFRSYKCFKQFSIKHLTELLLVAYYTGHRLNYSKIRVLPLLPSFRWQRDGPPTVRTTTALCEYRLYCNIIGQSRGFRSPLRARWPAVVTRPVALAMRVISRPPRHIVAPRNRFYALRDNNNNNFFQSAVRLLYASWSPPPTGRLLSRRSQTFVGFNFYYYYFQPQHTLRT